MSSRKRSRLTDTDDLVHLYLHEAGQYELLDKETEADLAQRIEAGGQGRGQLGGRSAPAPTQRRCVARVAREGDEAPRSFVQANLRLVVSIAKRYQRSGLPLLD